jgi:hypothetical protein
MPKGHEIALILLSRAKTINWLERVFIPYSKTTITLTVTETSFNWHVIFSRVIVYIYSQFSV